MPRSLSKDEQSVLSFMRRVTQSQPIPDIARTLGLPIEVVQTSCEYLVSRGLLQVAIYAVALPGRKEDSGVVVHRVG
jgi:hypothetical protein